MSIVETVGDTVVLRIGGEDGQYTFTALGARWLGGQLIARANDIDRIKGPTPVGLQHIAALKSLTDEVTQ